MRRSLVLLAAVALLVIACGDDGADQSTSTQASATPTAAVTTTTTTMATTTTADPNALVAGEARAAEGLSGMFGSGVVRFEAGPDDETLSATLAGTVPVEDGAGDVIFCMFCLDEIHLDPGIEIPLGVFAETSAAEFDALGIVFGGGTVSQNLMIVKDPGTGINVVKSPPEIESLTIDSGFEIPLGAWSGGRSVVAGPQGCVLEFTTDGLMLKEGSATLAGS